MIVQEPAPVMWAVEPATVHAPEAPKLTVRPEVEVAETLKSASPKVLSESAPNVIVWFAFAMLKDCGTSAAAL